MTNFCSSYVDPDPQTNLSAEPFLEVPSTVTLMPLETFIYQYFIGIDKIYLRQIEYPNELVKQMYRVFGITGGPIRD